MLVLGHRTPPQFSSNGSERFRGLMPVWPDHPSAIANPQPRPIHTHIFLLYFLSLFILRERGSVRAGEGAEREREREGERIPSRYHAVSAEPDAGLELTNRESMT